MDDIKIIKKIGMEAPVMIAGWPGMGNVALGVTDYLRRKLNATKFAQISLDPSVTVDSVVVEDGLAKLPPAPKNIFYYVKKPELVICEGEAQLPGPGGISLLNKVLDLATEIKAKSIYTGAAFPMPVSYKERPEVYGAANKEHIVLGFPGLGIRPMEEGHISGLNGLVLGLAAGRGIDAACLLATMPQYAVSLPNPKASRAIIEVMQKILGFNVDLGEMEGYIKDMDEKMSLIEEKVKDVFSMEREEPKQPPQSGVRKVPGYVMERIEKLFLEARLDRSKAIVLKNELDRWDLYKNYEDRFLDLFKGGQ
jgi:proteasome assembly chaperone (PAC2) family protein